MTPVIGFALCRSIKTGFVMSVYIPDDEVEDEDEDEGGGGVGPDTAGDIALFAGS